MQMKKGMALSLDGIILMVVISIILLAVSAMIFGSFLDISVVSDGWSYDTLVTDDTLTTVNITPVLLVADVLIQDSTLVLWNASSGVELGSANYSVVENTTGTYINHSDGVGSVAGAYSANYTSGTRHAYDTMIEGQNLLDDILGWISLVVIVLIAVIILFYVKIFRGSSGETTGGR